MTDSGRVLRTGLSQAEPQSAVGLGPSGFDPSRFRVVQFGRSWWRVEDVAGFYLGMGRTKREALENAHVR